MVVVLLMATRPISYGQIRFTKQSVDIRNVLLSKGVFNFCNSHLWARKKFIIRECVYQVRFTVTCLSGIVGDIIMGPNVLPDGFVFQDRHNFLEICWLGCGPGSSVGIATD